MAFWGIENALHWALDVVFGHDHARVRSRFGPRNMALVKRMAINLLKAPRIVIPSRCVGKWLLGQPITSTLSLMERHECRQAIPVGIQLLQSLCTKLPV